ncbi:lipopolysaccharide biosynthesis protein [Pseudomonas auratipiscis]|uniref:Lipopolysaccharide biosynthesis protein n=1 Tax=Pseudomonas auratipiscis TaxID=3115853 RepID=A0AB35WRD4_9PSED|nr:MULTISPECIES: lipopolysaccharide biosynthesis protein [unclassified Pseudomonas]MEE1867158.1 lipopolysaccharide biosynthesis protein [Pseudomonas sp. 120P]MEE1957985.1 lipopolysaccharide biosynthesis protein [Pseudomonas sp. 119P]
MSNYWKSVASVLTGATLAQVIPILGSLVIARIYSPAEFGIFASWLGLVTLLSVVLSARFETALAIEPDGEPRRIAVLATLVTACLMALVAGLGVALAMALLPELLKGVPWVLVVGAVPTALALTFAVTWQSWAAAEGNYRSLSGMRLIQAATVTLIQILVGFQFATAGALAMGHFAGVLIAVVASTWLMPTGRFPAGTCVSSIIDFWRRHKRFPIFSLPADSINAAAAQLPVLVVTSRFGAEVGGLLAMTMKILGAPIGLLGKAVLDVFKRHAATSYRERGECRAEYLRTFKVLLLASLLFCAVMVPWSEHLFALAFGESWREAGIMAIWMLPVFALRFIASPLSYMVYIAGKQHLDLFWQVALLLVTCASLMLLSGYDVALQVYSVGYATLYLVYLGMSYRFSLGVRN